MLSCVVTNREATYVLVFVEDIECFDGRHVCVKAVGGRNVKGSLNRCCDIQITSYTLRKMQEVGSKVVVLERGSTGHSSVCSGASLP